MGLINKRITVRTSCLSQTEKGPKTIQNFSYDSYKKKFLGKSKNAPLTAFYLLL